MRIYENGIYRDATPAEQVTPPDEQQTLEERLRELEAELAATKILLGVDE